MNRNECFGRRDDSSHLLVCPSCRTDARIAAAWRGLRVDEPAAPAEERFVGAVLRSVRRDRAAARRRRLIAAAAAAALFSFFAGLAHETAGSAAPDSEESYASLSAPNGLTEFLPN
jgi:hypothetical protein